MTSQVGRNIATLVLGLACWPAIAVGQVDQSRREIATPGLMLDTGTRTAACDVLTFTNNGQYLLATGDDRVVRTWKFTAKGLEPIADPPPAGVPQPVLRWTSHRERRGNIYAAAVSPDAPGTYIAVGGTGIRTSQFAILDRFSGRIASVVPYLSLEKAGGYSIWSVAFSPTQDQVACGTDGGGVWVWDWKAATPPRLIGQHHGPKDRTYNYVRFLAYQKNQLVSADEHGGVYRWNIEQPTANDKAKVVAFSNHNDPDTLIRAFAVSPDGQWLAAAFEASMVEIRSLVDGSRKTIQLGRGNFPNALAFDPAGKTLAVSIRVVDQTASFYKEIAHKIVLCDVAADEPRITQQFAAGYRIECLAFHPDGKHLAAAGGNNHDVNVYDVGNLERPLGAGISGPGECIWGVSISKDGRHLGFQTQRNANPDHPNSWGAGAPRVFDLERRLFTNDANPAWTPLTDQTVDGWKVLFSTKTVRRADQWFVQSPGGEILPIPLDSKDDEFPRCYTFLPKTAHHPTRLIVGHMWGASVFELAANDVKRTRLLTGHDGHVSALALSADGKRLITASRDQTIAGWSLEDWPAHPQLGASPFIKDGRLWIGQVDTGSPFWEAGLSTNDELLLLVIERKIIYNRSGKYGTDTGTPQAALQSLQKPKAGGEIYFGWKRPGSDQLVEQLTFLRDRPIWRFFPTKDNEWVLWRYQDFLYDTSTRGDSVIGWQRNTLDDKGEFNVKGTPVFYRAEQFRHSYHQPDKVTQTLLNWSRTGQDKSSFVDIEPAQIQLTVDGALGKKKVEVRDKGFALSIKAVPHSDRQNQELTRVILWINDHQFMKWEGDALRKHIVPQKNALGLTRGIFEIADVAIPPHVLRSGANVLFVQAYNKAEVRAESERIAVTNLKPRPPATMHGLFIGVGDYTKSRPRQDNLGAEDDAEVLADVWDRNRGKSYAKANMRVLKDKHVNGRQVLQELDTLAKAALPDDLFVFHLGGHGVSARKMIAGVREAKLPKNEQALFDQQIPTLSPFHFLCGDFNFLKVRDTTISLDDLYEKLVKLPCRKVIMLDACNSAAVDPAERKGTDIIRLFTKDGVGPIIFAACKADEVALERPGLVLEPASGLFAQAVVKAIQEDFGKAKKPALEPGDLFANLDQNVQGWVKKLKQDNPANKDLSQHPQFFLPAQERNFAILISRE